MEEVELSVHNHSLDTRSVITDFSYSVSCAEASRVVSLLFPSKEADVSFVTEASDTLLYVFNFDDGWILISGDKRCSPFLGQSEEGHLSINSSNENLNYWLESTASLVLEMKTIGIEEDNENTEFWETVNRTSKIEEAPVVETKGQTEYKWSVWKQRVFNGRTSTTVIVPHLISTKWGQLYPWNYKCPYDVDVVPVIRCPTGCTAVAMSQLVYYTHYYLEKPTGLYHQIYANNSIYGEQQNIGFLRSDYHLNSDRWDMMPLTASGSGNADYVGDLMLDIGNRVGMNYSGEGSGAYPSIPALSHYDL